MKKNSRLFVKVILTVIGLIIITYILAVSVRFNRMRQPEGESIPLQDVLILTQALNEEYSTNSVYIELQEKVSSESNAVMTYGQFCKLLPVIAQKDGKNIRSYGEEEWKEKYKEEFFMLKQDWYQIYDMLLADYNMQGEIIKSDITVIGIGADVTDEKGISVSEDRLLAEEGEYFFQSDAFRENKYQVVRVYRKGEQLLTVADIISRGYSIPNAWIMEAGEREIQIYKNGYELRIPYEKAEQSQREQVADMEFADGKLQSLHVKSEKINGKILSIRNGSIEISGYGTYPCQEEMKVYKLYGLLKEGKQEDLRIGYDFTDFVLEDGRICAGLITRDEAMENIRVVIKNTDFAGAYHEEVKLTSDTDFQIKYGNYEDLKIKECKAGETVTIDAESEYFIGERLYIEPAVLTGKIRILSIERAQGMPGYRGELEVAKTPEGLVIVNELLLEEYLYSVVPSEMPASYPLEALKAQAICARTYAYRNMNRTGLPGFGAHVDDSAGYQVYNNIAEHAQTTKAVKETSGQLLYYGDELCGSYYYSTSCGFGTDTNIWKSNSSEDTSYLAAERIGTDKESYTADSMVKEESFQSFITNSFATDYEAGEGWYRWEYKVKNIDSEKILSAVRERYDANSKLILTKQKDGSFASKPVKTIGKIKDIYIEKRNAGGVADELIIVGEKSTYKIISEHNIRYVLNDGVSMVVRQDGSEIVSPTLLPSAYFIIETSKEKNAVLGYTLVGGGYGHGVGMSQNGAKAMAEKEIDAQGILVSFYQGCQVKGAY